MIEMAESVGKELASESAFQSMVAAGLDIDTWMGCIKLILSRLEVDFLKINGIMKKQEHISL